MRGACLCGAVTVEVRGDHARQRADLSACHCDPCRQWSGATLWGFEVARGDFGFAGPVGSYRSSSFATRTWCTACGTQLWFADDDGPYEVNPGLFEETRDWPLARVVYAEKAPAHAVIAGDHSRQTKAEYEATERHVG